MDAAERRLARVNAHLLPSLPLPLPLASAPLLAPSPTAASSSPAGDSYRRVHGDVPSEPPEWRVATDEDGKDFVDILYEKSVGEGIAKVKHFFATHNLVKLFGFWQTTISAVQCSYISSLNDCISC
jgi:naphthoate synthase